MWWLLMTRHSSNGYWCDLLLINAFEVPWDREQTFKGSKLQDMMQWPKPPSKHTLEYVSDIIVSSTSIYSSLIFLLTLSLFPSWIVGISFCPSHQPFYSLLKAFVLIQSSHCWKHIVALVPQLSISLLFPYPLLLFYVVLNYDYAISIYWSVNLNLGYLPSSPKFGSFIEVWTYNWDIFPLL